MTNKFHEHLDMCEQCREHPFSLCTEGAKLLLEQFAAEIDDDIDPEDVLPSIF